MKAPGSTWVGPEPGLLCARVGFYLSKWWELSSLAVLLVVRAAVRAARLVELDEECFQAQRCRPGAGNTAGTLLATLAWVAARTVKTVRAVVAERPSRG
jgi:hypothetical protein